MAKPLVALDIGHGRDTYPPSKGVPEMPEFEFNNAVVKHMIPHLERNQIDYMLTQPIDGTDTPLSQRSSAANRRNAKILMSFHADWNEKSNARGHWAFYWHTSSNGKRLATIWQEEVAKARGDNLRSIQASRRNHWTNFHMLRETNMPAVLMEHGFMSNRADLNMLLDDGFRRRCAEAAVRTICRYFALKYVPEGSKEEKPMEKENDIKGHWAEHSINQQIDKGRMQGFPDGSFRPDEPITRAQMAVILERLDNE